MRRKRHKDGGTDNPSHKELSKRLTSNFLIRPLSVVFVVCGAYCIGLGLSMMRFVNLPISFHGISGNLFPAFPDILDFAGLVVIGSFLFCYGLRLNSKR